MSLGFKERRQVLKKKKAAISLVPVKVMIMIRCSGPWAENGYLRQLELEHMATTMQ